MLLTFAEIRLATERQAVFGCGRERCTRLPSFSRDVIARSQVCFSCGLADSLWAPNRVFRVPRRMVIRRRRWLRVVEQRQLGGRSPSRALSSPAYRGTEGHGVRVLQLIVGRRSAWPAPRSDLVPFFPWPASPQDGNVRAFLISSDAGLAARLTACAAELSLCLGSARKTEKIVRRLRRQKSQAIWPVDAPLFRRVFSSGALGPSMINVCCCCPCAPLSD